MSRPDAVPEPGGPAKNITRLRPLVGLARRVGSFVLVGGVATGVQYLLLVLLIELIGVFAVLASAIAYCAAAVISYLLNFHMTFQGRSGHRQALPRFVVVVAVGLGVNTLSFTLLLIFFPYLLAQVGATLVTLVSNYLLHQHWIYRSRA